MPVRGTRPRQARHHRTNQRTHMPTLRCGARQGGDRAAPVLRSALVEQHRAGPELALGRRPEATRHIPG